MKKAHSCETPRSRGLERAIRSSAAAFASATRSVATDLRVGDPLGAATDFASATRSVATDRASATRSLARSLLVIVASLANVTASDVHSVTFTHTTLHLVLS